MAAVKIVVLVLGTAVLLYVSRAPLRSLRSHGFYRFFAWEAILALAVLNVEHWFEDPVSPWQIASWLFLVVSAFLVIHGVNLLRLVGRPDRARAGEELIAFEKTSRLVTAGAYRYIRHPLYSSLLFLAWGVFLKRPSWPGAALALVASVFLFLTARVEEGENVRFFGQEYRDYMRRTRMFVPFLF